MYIPKNAFYNPNFNPYKVNCEQQVCDGIDAFVNCITNILQGRWGCIKIQLVDSLGLPLDISTIKSIEIIVTNSLGYYVGTWGWVKDKMQPENFPKVDIYQRPVKSITEDDDIWVEYDSNDGYDKRKNSSKHRNDYFEDEDLWVEYKMKNASAVTKDSDSGSGQGDEITNMGLIGITLTPEQTYVPSGALTAQIVVTTDEKGICNTFVINCIVLANIVKNMAGVICNTNDDTDIINVYKHLNIVIVPVNIAEIPLDANIKEIFSVEDIEDIGYYYISDEDKYYQCTYYTPEMDDNDRWVIYDI
ncbi:hypothetical protein [uncultured Methanobrevibacter sp.]|uniref:hypothetical protein n=1 Tax=uncultured Methanobrevibacter sp. TaxID=253161 RepID=UPI0025FA0982|nr:hypothetical protein [uncultured Methanobrevibacter sp.]